MRKILYSSVALIASCGVAAAEVSVGGDASIGIKFTEGSDNELTIAHNVDLNLTLSGQTDGGLSFGASVTITNAQGVDLTTETADYSTDPVSNEMNQTVTVSVNNTVDLGGATLRKNAGGVAVAIESDSRIVYLDSGGATDYAVDLTAAEDAVAKLDGSTDEYGIAAFEIRSSGAYNGAKANVFTPVDSVATIGDTTYYAVLVDKQYSVYYETESGWTNTVLKNISSAKLGNDSAENIADVASIIFSVGVDGKLEIDISGTINVDEIKDLTYIALAKRNANIAAGKVALADSPPTIPQEHVVTFTDTDKDTDTDSVVTSASLQNKAVVYISGGFGKISVGDISAADTAASGIADIGYSGLGVDDVAESLRGKSDAEVLYEFSAAGVSIGVSGSTKRGSDSGFALGVKYSLDPISFGIGYADEGGTATVSAGIGATLGDVSTNLMYSSKDGGDNAVGMDASFKASENMTVTISGANSEIGGEEKQAYGIGLTFDLGGGASLGTGFASVDGTAKGDLGLNLEF